MAKSNRPRRRLAGLFLAEAAKTRRDRKAMTDPLACLRSLPRQTLAHLPTPLEPMPRLGSLLGLTSLWVKRDDCTGLGLGGNKVRKLEFNLAAALQAKADCVVCGGVVQSN